MKNKKIISGILAIVSATLLVIPTIFGSEFNAASVSTIDASKKGTLTLHKYQQTAEVSGDLTTDGSIVNDTNIPVGATPLSDVQFTIYYLGNNIGTPNYKTSVDAANSYVVNNNIIGVSLTTGSTGVITFNNLALGQYLVKETASPVNVSEPTPAFIVNVPTTVTDAAGIDSWLYDVHVYPKNQTIYGGVLFTKLDQNGNVLKPITSSGTLDTNLQAGFQLYYYNNVTNTLGSKYLESTLYTNLAGQIAVNNLPKGYYAFVETKAPVGYGINSTPLVFEITTSGTVIVDSAGLFTKSPIGTVVDTSFVNNLTPIIHKGVKSVTNQYAGYNFKESHAWVISPSVPKDIANYKKYIVTDTIDLDNFNVSTNDIANLTVYKNGTWTADTATAAGVYSGGTKLTLNTDYTVTYSSTTGLLTVTFINETSFVGGKAALADANSLYIFFTTTFNESKVQLGADYPNQAKIVYNNGFMVTDDTKTSETPKVHTGGLSFVKYTVANAQNKFLPGAEFKLATSEQNAKNGVFVQYNGVDITAVSDENGIVKFKGIAYGVDGSNANSASTVYFLVETKSPTVNGIKYNLLTSPVQVTINASSHVLPFEIGDIRQWTVSILNQTGIKLPTTGGTGTLFVYLFGFMFMITAVLIGIKPSKKEKESDLQVK